MSPLKITIVGGGMIGCAWAALFARAGHDVTVFDASEDALERVPQNVAGLLADLDSPDSAQRISVQSSLQNAVGDADYVQECVPEIIAIKQSVFADIAKFAPVSAIIASSTSALMPSLFTEGIPGRDRTLVAHPINPPHLHTAVELVPAPWTSKATVDRARRILESAGMEPIELSTEIDGFVVNRLQSAILHEAFRLVADGVVSARDIDRAVIGALAPRWSFMGLFETIDLNAPKGITEYVERYEELYQRLGLSQSKTVSWLGALDQGLLCERTEVLPRSELDARRKWRDIKLADIARARRANATR